MSTTHSRLASSWVQLGLVLWLLLVLDSVSMHHRPEAWIGALIGISTLILMPGSVELWSRSTRSNFRQSAELMAAFVLMGAILSTSETLDPFWKAALAIPWLALRSLSALDAIRDLFQSGSGTPGRLLILAARGFPAIGAAWLVAWCAGWMPFGFSPLIVLLTGAHFHHAGFTLPLIAGLTSTHRPSFLSLTACRLILAGVPLVAVGITCTHFQVALWIEPMAVAILVLGALLVGFLQLHLAFDSSMNWGARSCLGFAGLSLLAAMLLAVGFGLRLWFPQFALPMDRMWTIHGTLNAIGFGGFGIAGWHLIDRQMRAPPLPA